MSNVLIANYNDKKYCRHCGQPLKLTYTFSHYERNTGVKLYRGKLFCPRWHPLWRFKHDMIDSYQRVLVDGEVMSSTPILLYRDGSPANNALANVLGTLE